MDSATFRRIKKQAVALMKNTRDPQHSVGHLERVEQNALKIAKILGLEEKLDLNLLGSACYLHDLAFIKNNPGLINYFREGKRVKKIVSRLLRDYQIPDDEKKIITTAVWKHTLNFPFRRLNKKEDDYAKILQDADILDMFHPERLLSFVTSAKKFFFYKTLKIFSKRVSRWTIKHMSLFLNYPELAKEF